MAEVREYGVCKTGVIKGGWCLLRQDWWRERELNGVRWPRWTVHFFIIHSSWFCVLHLSKYSILVEKGTVIVHSATRNIPYCAQKVCVSVIFTFVWPCIVTNFFLIKNQKDARISQILFCQKLYIFPAFSLTISGSFLPYIRHWYISCRFLMTASKQG